MLLHLQSAELLTGPYWNGKALALMLALNLIALAPRSGLLWSPIFFDAGRKITINFLLPFIDFVPDGYWGWLFPRTI